ATVIVPQDVRPHIYRTTDRGATWQAIVQGLPATAFARVVREDPVRKGLLYCGTESGVYVSFDAGDHWQSLQLNLPASSMRDLLVRAAGGAHEKSWFEPIRVEPAVSESEDPAVRVLRRAASLCRVHAVGARDSRPDASGSARRTARAARRVLGRDFGRRSERP